MSRLWTRRSVLTALALLLLAIVLPPLVNVGRFRPRVASVLGTALGRPVTIGEVSLRLFPRPGLQLQHVVVQDDPAFSAEPLLRADEVTAALRLGSLWRGRLEIASISLSYPSLNLVRGPNGHWNLESLLERARQTPTAPTTKARAESRPRFPYVEASGGRINLKIGQEKTVYALGDADFALSLPSENQWSLQVTARPIRTDANLSDIGRIRISGTIERGSSLSYTPLNLRVSLEDAQLGQLTTLLYGRDRGWRGTTRVAALLIGTPAAMKISGDASVDDFRRYDIASSGPLRLATHCSAMFSSLTQQVGAIACHSSVDDGAVDVRGDVLGVLPPRGYKLAVEVQRLPAASLAALAQRMKKDLPEDLAGAGTVTASFDLQAGPSGRLWTGTGSASALELRTKLLRTPLELRGVRFTLTSPDVNARHSRTTDKDPPPAGVVALRVDPFALDLGGTKPAKAHAWFVHDSYHLDVEGDARVERLLELAHAAGIRAPEMKATGSAAADLEVSGNWSGFAAPLVTGNLKLHTVTATVPGFGALLEIASAALHLSPDAAAIYDAAGGFAGTHLNFTGSFAMPRGCVAAESCRVAFQLRTEHLATDELNRLLNPKAQKRPWYDIIGASRSATPFLAKVTAVGRIAVSTLQVKTLAASKVAGDARLEHSVLTIGNLRGDVAGGSATAELRADFSGAAPVYRLRGSLRQASVASAAAVVHENWGTGRANAKFEVAANGWNAEQLRASAAGSVVFDWSNGSLARLTLNGAPPPLKITQFHGELSLRDGQFTFSASKMETPAGIYVVSGTASLDRELELRLARGKTQIIDVTGTLDNPHATAVTIPATQAALKP
ncbi:MAG: AsmA family protein [Terriglobales bacterium]